MSSLGQDFQKFVQGKALRPILSEIAESITAASRADASKWGLRVNQRDLMLKVGFVEVLQAGDGWFHFLVKRDLVPKRLMTDRRFAFDKKSPYKNAPGCTSCDVAASHAARAYRALRSAHKAALRIAANSRRHTTTIKDHSPEFVKFLARSLGTRLPQPSYHTANAAVKRGTVAKRLAHQTTLHIVQGGIENGDKKWLEKAAQSDLKAPSWIVPKSVRVGDDVVVYVASYGFFATAKIATRPKPRANWKNRYGAGLKMIRLIEPAISLSAIRRHIPELTWAVYPRSITTPPAEIASEIRKLISARRKTGLPDLDDEALQDANIDELRKAALLSARSFAAKRRRTLIYRVRSKAIHLYVLSRANGHCEGCDTAAPFRKPDGSPYLEPHHTTRLADDGPDHPARVIGLCPSCHRRAHHAEDANVFNRSLKKKLSRLEPPK
jgi:hypothetical protein